MCIKFKVPIWLTVITICIYYFYVIKIILYSRATLKEMEN